MLDFHPLTLDKLPELRPYFQKNDGRICDTTPASTFIWRDLYHVEYAIEDDMLFFKVIYPGLGDTFTLPLCGERREHYCRIAEYCCQHQMPISFYPVPAPELDALQEFFPNSAAISDRDTYDYLYRAEDLKYFRGKKLGGQRNHVNKFRKTYDDWFFRAIEPEDIPDIKDFLKEYTSQVEKPSASFHEDIAKTIEVLDNYELYDLLGGILFAEGDIVGFALGEVVGDTLFTHIEKANRRFQGGYQMLVSQYAQLFAVDGVDFINREDDTGDMGLRTSKLSYQPVSLLEKFTVTIEEPCGACGCADED